MPATRTSLGADLARLGVRQGSVLMVHAGVRSIGPVTGGVNVIVQALLDAVGPTGTLVAYVDYEPFHEDTDEVEIPVFDKRIAHAARDHGVLHETLRTWPGAHRSDHPDAGVVAIGAMAAWITVDHPFQFGYGMGTPFDKALRANVQVLMLGAPLDTITLLHYAEDQARIPDKRIRTYRRLMPGPNGPEWRAFEEFDTSEPVNDRLPSDCFEIIAREYLSTGRGSAGTVGAASSTIMDGAELVKFGIEWLERFFYPGQERPGMVDAES
ncbi:MAG: aminoglycoside 3-N-acetyltransferase [Bryobacteraceae bacterium]